MRHSLRLSRLLWCVLLGFACVSGAGCLSFYHPVVSPPGEVEGIVGDLPAPSAQGVDVFVFDGVDPLGYANVTGVRDHLRDAGFSRVWLGEVYHGHYFRKQVRLIRQHTPREKIVVVGFDYGAEAARSMASDLAAEGIEIDLLVLLEPRGLSLAPTSPLLPILRKIAVRGESGSESLQGYETVRLRGLDRWQVPTAPATVRLLTEEINRVALRVEVVGPSPFPIELRELPPPPRPIAGTGTPLPAEWSFIGPNDSR